MYYSFFPDRFVAGRSFNIDLGGHYTIGLPFGRSLNDRPEIGCVKACQYWSSGPKLTVRLIAVLLVDPVTQR
ncbi:hypothetical protein BpHYR1_015014 [Brachionus plicatilis]|uniref:Uncharacterized protein n=1 Tax=Brachionus plicatilis TaxID=10195 RepID=A0A3M7T457_BRAPC|nr:hypothetical protein BpHYR1_015014 [Brachionus plicatilis]